MGEGRKLEQKGGQIVPSLLLQPATQTQRPSHNDEVAEIYRRPRFPPPSAVSIDRGLSHRPDLYRAHPLVVWLDAGGVPGRATYRSQGVRT